MKKIILILFLLCEIVFAQQPSFQIIGEDDLAGISIYSIVQDKDNSILISSNNGVYRYNSLSFTALKSNELGDLSIFGLTKNVKNEIFCYNLSGQIFKIENNQLQPYFKIPQRFLSNTIFIGFDNEQNLMISCKALLLIKSHQIKKAIYTFQDGNAALIENNEKGDLIFTDAYKIFTYSNGELKRIQDLPKSIKNLCKPFLFNKNEVGLSVSTEPKFSLLKKGRIKWFTPIQSKNGEVFYHYYSKNKRLIWLACSQNGIYCSNLNGELLFNGQRLFSNYFISSHLEDFEGNIWLTTFGKGIIFIPNLKLIDYSNTNLLKEDDLLRVTQKDNAIYFGGSKGIVYKLYQDKIEKIKEGFSRIEFFHYDKNAHAFFVNSQILDENFNLISNQQYNKYTVFKKNSSYWYTTREGLFELKDINKLPTHHNYSIRSYDVVIDQKNKYWIASSTGLEYGDLSKLNKITYHSEPIFASKIIEIKDQIWVASSKGIFVFKDGKLCFHLNDKNGLISNKPLKLILNAEYLFISHHQGIQQYNLRNKKIKNFTKEEGLIANAIFDFVINKNECIVITAKGLQKIDFNEIKIETIMPKIKLQNWNINGVQKSFQHEPLKFNENTIDFFITAISHKYRNKLQYQYILEGYDKNWQTSDITKNRIKYQFLPPGEYVFQIRSKLNDKLGTIQNFKFVIDTIFWKKPIFYIPFIIIFTLLIYGGYKLHIRNLVNRKNIELEKERYQHEINRSQLMVLKSQMNPHFIFNALNSIQDFIIHNQKDLASDYLADFADLMRGYLDKSQVDFISIHEEIELLHLYLKLEKIRFDNDFDFTIQTDNLLDTINITIPSFLIQPYVENAIKHGLLHKKGNKQLDVIFELTNRNTIKCIIRDNGIGRKASEKLNLNRKHKSFATQANQNRVALLNKNAKEKIQLITQDLYATSGEAIGLLVELIIPINE